MSNAEPGYAGEPPARVRGWPLVVGIAVALAAGLACDLVHPAPGEAAWLRWLRIFAAHPVRSSAAATLVFVALFPRARPFERPEDPTRR